MADRIVRMAETEQSHAHRQARFLGWTERLGLLSAVAAAFGIMGTIAYCAVNGHPSVAKWLGGGFYSSVVIAFITGRGLGRQEKGPKPGGGR